MQSLERAIARIHHHHPVRYELGSDSLTFQPFDLIETPIRRRCRNGCLDDTGQQQLPGVVLLRGEQHGLMPFPRAHDGPDPIGSAAEPIFHLELHDSCGRHAVILMTLCHNRQ